MNQGTRDLSKNLTADYAALQNDLEQARCLAGDYQKQLCDKSNDLATLKLTFEKAFRDLEHLQANIVVLREERHRLANEAMRAVALEHKLGIVKEELDRFAKEALRVVALERDLATMTEERNRLANTAMRTVDLERRLAAATDELKRLRGPREGPRETIDVTFDGSEKVVISPTAAEPRRRGR